MKPMRTVIQLVLVFSMRDLTQAQEAESLKARQLSDEKAFQEQELKFHDAMLATTSFAKRTDLFCKDAADNFLGDGLLSHQFTPDASPRPTDVTEALEGMQRRAAEVRHRQDRHRLLDSIVPHGSHGITISELKKAYAELTGQDPSTREGEVLKQNELSAIREALGEYALEFDACRRAVLRGDPETHNGWQRPIPPFPLPTDQELRSEAAKERERIAQIDQELRNLRVK